MANVATSYTQEYYVEQADGTYKKVEALTEVLSTYNGAETKIGTEVTFVGKEIEGYELVENQGVLSGKVYANGRLVLKGYYKAVETSENLGLINVAETSSVSLSEYSFL